jgi:ABC-type nitrate/sulfonate/bicarbonate transport system permease component
VAETNNRAETLASTVAVTREDRRSPAVLRPQRFWLSRVRLMQIVSVVVLLGLWKFISTQTSSLTLPGPVPVFVALVRLLFSWEFWHSLLISVQSLALGYAVSVVIGLIAGVAVGLISRRMGVIFDAYLIIGLSVPIAGLIPVVVMVLGIGLAARVMVVVLFAVFQIAINVVTGVREADRSLVEMAHSFGASYLRVFWRIILPDAVPSIMAGMRLGLGRGIVGMVTSELILLSVGVGRMVVKFSSSFQTAKLLAYLILIVAFGVVMMAGVQWLERRLTRWYK